MALSVAAAPAKVTSRPLAVRLPSTRSKASSSSTVLSAVTSTLTVCVLVEPAAKLTAWAMTAAKSLAAVALPSAVLAVMSTATSTGFDRSMLNV